MTHVDAAPSLRIAASRSLLWTAIGKYSNNLVTLGVMAVRAAVGSGQLQFNSHPDRGASTFRLCRNVTVPGRYKLRGKLTYGPDDTTVWIKPGFFRLRKTP